MTGVIGLTEPADVKSAEVSRRSRPVSINPDKIGGVGG